MTTSNHNPKSYLLSLRFYEILLEVMAPIFMILNFSSGIIGAIWLLLTGAWYLVVVGFLGLFFIPFMYGILSIPSLGLSVLGIKTYEKHKIIGIGLLGVALIFSNIILCYIVLYVFNIFVITEATYSSIALTLWGYSVVQGALSGMARREGEDATGSWQAVFYGQILYLIITILYYVEVPFASVKDISYLLTVIYSIFFAVLYSSSLRLEDKEEYADDTHEAHKDYSLYEDVDTCKNCGAQANAEAKFCRNCGSAIER